MAAFICLFAALVPALGASSSSNSPSATATPIPQLSIAVDPFDYGRVNVRWQQMSRVNFKSRSPSNPLPHHSPYTHITLLWQISWPLSRLYSRFAAVVSPFSYIYDWTQPYAAIPDAVSWVIDDRNDQLLNFTFNTTSAKPQLVMQFRGNSSCLGGSNNPALLCPMMYRRLPDNPILSVTVDLRLGIPSNQNILAGLLVYNARSNSPLAICGLRRTGATTYVFGMWSNSGGTWTGSAGTPRDASSWNGFAYVQLSHNSAGGTGSWVCSGKALAGTAWASANILTSSDTR